MTPLRKMHRCLRQRGLQSIILPFVVALTFTVTGGAEENPLPDLSSARQLVTENPDDIEANLTLGRACYSAQLLEEALRIFRHVNELAPDNIEALVNSAVIIIDQGRPQEAVEILRRALEVKADDLSAMCNLAQAYYAMGDAENAVGSLVRAIKIDDQYQDAHFLLGIYFAEAKLYLEALREWQAVIDIDPSSAGAIQARANIKTLESMMVR